MYICIYSLEKEKNKQTIGPKLDKFMDNEIWQRMFIFNIYKLWTLEGSS